MNLYLIASLFRDTDGALTAGNTLLELDEIPETVDEFRDLEDRVALDLDESWIVITNITLLRAGSVTDLDKLRDDLSSYAHRTWGGWMAYMFSKSEKKADGSVVIPADLVDRWTRQMNTVYDDLPATEKLSDNQEAEFIMKILRGHGVLK